MKLSILAFLLLTSIVSATVLPLALTTITAPASTDDTHAVFFPGTAHAIDRPKAPTNAELIKRGQPLAKPAKLYGAANLAKRCITFPPTPGPSGLPLASRAVRNAYRFVSCASSVTCESGSCASASSPDLSQYAVSSDDLQQQADECAGYSQADGAATGNIERFVIGPGNDINCFTRAASYKSEACTSSNFAVYEVIP